TPQPGDVLDAMMRGRRLAAASEHEVAAPDLPDLSSLPEDVGRDPVGAPEDVERREGDGELLFGGRLHAHEAALFVNDLPRLEVDGDRRPRGAGKAADRQR